MNNIRLYNKFDVKYINDIGNSYVNNFEKLYDLNKLLNDNINKIYVYDYEEILGFIHLTVLNNEIDIINIVVKDTYRNKQIGTKLLKHVLKIYNNHIFYLEVSEDNISAIKLYEKFNFKTINKRVKYYEDKDALIMKKENNER